MRIALSLLLALGGASAAQAQCRLALALALDVSSSVNQYEYDLQRRGLAAALDSEDVRHAILRGAPGEVVLAVYEWSGRTQQKLHLDWLPLRSAAEIDRAVVTLAGMTRSHDEFPTALGHGVAYGALLLEKAPKCTRRVIDVSGDGMNNHGYGPRTAYRHFPMKDVTVNGLVITGGPSGVVEFYHNQVKHGPAAFVEVANGFHDFEAAMTRKLYREISDLAIGAPLPALLDTRPKG
ncbi:DUF1194 domain-containing protein [Roseovarius aestuarii]|uniref:von Willebrand factor type A domain protein n=1 Tax=Roseovarius aestuarii TaxID=475083 RepID=A0A1X7BLV5_9RHOB|nr:DUF1194 domain-containing protein [Roseovarius aestuarii]SMC10583.1 hypothetical protein ROA7745_00390 [Roseovarius aestuarii]